MVLAVVKEYIESTNPTFETFKEVFKDNIQGNLGVLQTISFAKSKDTRRYFLKANEILTTRDEVDITVCNQWGVSNIDNFIKVEEQLGYVIEKEDV